MSSDASSKTSSFMSHYPSEQRGSFEFQRELMEISRTYRHPISPSAIISEVVVANIAGIESTRSTDSSFQLFLAPSSSNEKYTKEAQIEIEKLVRKGKKKAFSSFRGPLNIQDPILIESESPLDSLDEVIRITNDADHEYIPDPSPKPYVPTPQPKLEGII
ncbi:hypothetical protein POM88_023626 [Heracleum sosnowskyi]|uniref:Uncharacterized protein n=1 Tax=Heracleum sosnowskyi TaxID=360622 RepID=A0AAD8MUL5_9APIA|nr:hypothetical protein POM88_023626 [Heracleum sosnowskyi]